MLSSPERGRKNVDNMDPVLNFTTTTQSTHTFPPCVVIATRNPLNNMTNFLVALLDPGCTGLVITSSAAEGLELKTWE